jgi:outer membrane lipoprotein-sorting protein
MKSAEEIRELFQNAGLSTHRKAHEQVFRDVLGAYQQTIVRSPVPPGIWRFAMRHPTTKYAAAAVFVLALVAAVGLFHRTGSVSWAIEQSVEAMSQYTALLIEGSASQRAWAQDGSLELRPFKVWGVANADQTKVEQYRFEFDGVTMLVTDGHKTWKYEPQAHRVTISNRPYVAFECWLGSGFLEQLKQAREAHTITHWQETSAQDPATGKPRVILTVAWLEARWNGPRSLRLEFDPESKLLVRMEQWDNVHQEGQAAFTAEKITYYESLPAELFTFTVPPGATVVEQ